MTVDAWITTAVLVGAIVMFSREKYPAAIVTLGAVIALHLSGVVDHSGAFGGLANQAPITIAALYILAAGVEATGALTGLTEKLLGRSDKPRERTELARIAASSAAASAFIANTPLVAMLAPRIEAWCRQTDRSASRYLMPLSYAAVLGGVITVLGTSTNLTLNGLLQDAGMEPFGLFEFTGVGLTVAAVGVIVLVVVTPWLLPRREGSRRSVLVAAREFTVEMVVAKGGHLDGGTVEGAGLRHLQGVFLVEIERRGRVISPVAPEEVLEGDDRLVFAGDISRVVDLQGRDGLSPAAEEHFTDVTAGRRFYEAVVGPALVGQNLRQADFRNRFGAAVFAIHRAGVRLTGKLGDIDLRNGDVLMVVADSGFSRRWRDHEGLLLVSPYGDSVPLRRDKAGLVRLVVGALILVAATGILDLTQAALLSAAAMVAFGVLSFGEARDAIDINIVLLVALSFGLGEAVDVSGLDEVLALGLVSMFSGLGDIGILLGILLATMIATELLSNNAAAILLFPVGMEAAAQAGIDFRALAVAILIGASCSFLTPIGYQTNTLVYGLGGYRFGDFARVGAPLTLVTIVVTMLTIPIFFPLR
ncbi:MAG: SLC13 family permease [Acidimicrobiia bacterium]